MAYIGKSPVIGNFVKLDAITAVNGQAAYTMQNGGSNFTDYESVNQFLVSLNGTIQAPTDSFTVSGSTLTFASNLATGDVIDFVMVFGNSLSAGVPTDDTVSTAKIVDSAVTNSKVASSIINSQTAETSIADADEVLIYDSSASALRKMTKSNFVSGVGQTNTPYFLATLSGDQDIGYTGVWTKISMNSEIHDSAGAYDTSNYRFTPQTAGKYWVHCQIQFEATANSNQTPIYKSAIYKNGSTIGNYVMRGSASMRQHTPFFGRILDMNGSSDYIECYAQADGTGSGSNRIAAGIASSSFGAYFIAT